MPRQVLNNLDTFGVQRAKLNGNFEELYDIKADVSAVLLKTNTTPYTPSTPYHPATKQYADNVSVNIIGIYDPTGVNSDAFDRANHYGNMPAVNVTQDSDHRFASDAEKTSWNNKEDSIGAKGTAFNKDYGTTPGTTATGDHSHTGTYEPANVNIQDHIATITGNPHHVTAAEVGAEPENPNIQGHIATVSGNPHAVDQGDVGLGNVDNTGDADKPVSNPTQTALDDKMDKVGVDIINFTPRTEVGHTAGDLFYDNETQSLSFDPDVDMTLNLGQEEVIRVVNNSGAIIPDGSPVYISGASLGFPTVELAIASAPSTASVPGIATHEIGIGAQGFITHAGRLGYSNAWTPGDVLYLSDTVPGGIVTVPPDILTVLGTVLSADKILVRINSNASLPTVVAYMNDGALPATINATPTVVNNFTDSGNVVMGYDATAGTITVPSTGVYRIAATVNFTHNDTGNNSDVATLSIYDGATDVLELDFAIGRNQEGTNMSLQLNFSGIAGTTYSLRVSSGLTLTGVVENAVSYAIESVSIR